ncbi:DUF3253 domain-containing protein [Pseudoxanthomonas sp. JBR18]|uniref:DUF3253 domain-containing protein n=1 Tax=Pseudoxanthomonas sp. JBR18 TaxID=2969308 RepID=UPI0023069B6A|nr:DUF3253 domain-containing protein [Pseudoxanthomonas sp. JBR18]WCE06072.1 DUF3253 domain-containing protein [Pseudoxanthomonas sp. JBR18]
MAVPSQAIGDTLLRLLAQRDPNASLCPSEVARALNDDEDGWRALMPQVREVAALMIADGRLQACQRGRPVDIHSAVGPIRLRRGPRFTE